MTHIDTVSVEFIPEALLSSLDFAFGNGTTRHTAGIVENETWLYPIVSMNHNDIAIAWSP